MTSESRPQPQPWPGTPGPAPRPGDEYPRHQLPRHSKDHKETEQENDKGLRTINVDKALKQSKDVEVGGTSYAEYLRNLLQKALD